MKLCWSAHHVMITNLYMSYYLSLVYIVIDVAVMKMNPLKTSP